MVIVPWNLGRGVIPRRTARMRNDQDWVRGMRRRTLACALLVDGASIDLQQRADQYQMMGCGGSRHTRSSEALGAVWIRAFMFPLAMGQPMARHIR